MTRQRAVLLMVLCLGTAAILRLSDLTEIPPGAHHDEAANGILAAEVGARRGGSPFLAGEATEALYFYLAGGLMRLLGESLFVLRLTSAFLGVLTVAATYWLGRELLADRRVAVVAAALLAVSFWHLLFSRLGFRAIAQPLFQALAVAALFRGLKRNDYGWLVLGGVCLGLSAYTYLAARLLLLPLGLALLPLLAGRAQRQRFFQLALYLGVGLSLLAPLLFSSCQNPAGRWLPAGSAGSGNDPFSLTGNLLASLGMLFLVGDDSWRLNLPGRPLFNWFWGGLLVVGWLILLRRREWGWYDWQKASMLLLLLHPFFMILPAALVAERAGPDNMLAIGLIPFIFYLPALGLVRLAEELADRFRGRDEAGTRLWQALGLLEQYHVNYAAVVIFVLFLGGSFTARDYFLEWGRQSEPFYEADGDLQLAAEFIDATSAEEVYLAAGDYGHPTVAFATERSRRIKWLLDGQALALPPDGAPLYVYPRSIPRPEWAAPYLARVPAHTGPAGPDGQPTFIAYTPVLTHTGPQNAEVNFGNVAHLAGYEAGVGQSGKQLSLLLHWRIVAVPETAVRPFVQLEDSWGNRWSLATPEAYLTADWEAGERLLQQVEVPVPAGTPPGNYRLRVGLFAPDSGRRLPRLDAEGRYAGDSVLIEGARIDPGEARESDAHAPAGDSQDVRAGLSLLGYQLGQQPVPAGERLPLALWWYADREQPSLTVRLFLRGEDNVGRILLDSQPVHGTYPFSRWPAHQFVIDKVNPQIPASMAAGNYRLAFSLLAEGWDAIYTGELGTVQILAPERAFRLPALRHPLAATFAGEITLAGYELERIADNQVDLLLAWQSLAAPASDYTVFVRVLNGDGGCCLWQEERTPRHELPAGAEAYPTGGWQAGEVVTESYRIELPADTPAGSYPLEVSLYRAGSGRPVQVVQPGLPDSDRVELRPLELE